MVSQKKSEGEQLGDRNEGPNGISIQKGVLRKA